LQKNNPAIPGEINTSLTLTERRAFFSQIAVCVFSLIYSPYHIPGLSIKIRGGTLNV
jgi:hypothetical protein